MASKNQILTGNARPVPRAGEMILDPGPRNPLQINTAQGVGTVRSNERAFVGADLARADMGQAVAGIGSNMAELGIRQMQAVNVVRQAEAASIMDANEAEMTAAMAKEPDELKWEGIAKSYSGKARDQIGKLAMSPVAKEVIDSNFSRWEGQRVGHSKILSARESFAKAKNEIIKKADLAKMRQSPAEFEANLEAGKKLGVFSDAETELEKISYTETGKKLEKKVYQEKREATAERLAASMQADPWQTLADLKANSPDDESRSSAYPDLDAQDRLRAIADAEQQVRAVQSDQLGGEGGIRDRIVTGDLDDKGIDDAVEGLRLGAEDAQKLKNFRAQIAEQKASNLPLDRKAVGALIGEIEAYQGDDKSDPIAAKWGELVQRAEVLTAAGGKEGDLTRGVLMQKIYQRHPGAERRTDKDMPEGMEKEFNAYLEAYRKDGAFGVPEYRVAPKMEAGKDGIAPVAGEFVMEPNPAANARYVASQNRLWQELKSEYKAKPETVLAPGALEGWVKDRMKGFKAGAQVEKMRAAPAGPDATLFPVIPDPTDLDNFLK